MVATKNKPPKNKIVSPLPEIYEATVTLADPESIRSIFAHSAGIERADFLANAMRLGITAMDSLSGQIDALRIEKEVNRLLTSLKDSLSVHQLKIDEQLEKTLGGYFDPDNGELPLRLKQLTKDGGELHTILEEMVGDEHSVMAQTLSEFVGQDSKLYKLLDPTQAKGLVAKIEATLNETLANQQKTILREFSLDNKKGALTRLIEKLADSQGELTEGLEEQIDDLVEQFSLNNRDSAINRMLDSVKSAQKTITADFSLDNKDSALSRLRLELTELIDEQNKAAVEFRQEMKNTLSVLEAKKKERENSTGHGNDFEEDVVGQLRLLLRGSEDSLTATGNKVGSIKSCKKGDAVIEMGPEHLAAGTRIVLEAKKDKRYTLEKARSEIEQARKNRKAQIGIFVFCKSHSPDEMEPFIRIGDDIFIQWDPSDPTTDVFLQASISLAKGLCTKSQRANHQLKVDVDALEGAVNELVRQNESLKDIKTWTETITSNSDKIQNRLRISRRSITKQISVLEAQIQSIQSLGA